MKGGNQTHLLFVGLGKIPGQQPLGPVIVLLQRLVVAPKRTPSIACGGQQRRAAITLSAILQRVGAIQKPGAYLRNLTERAANGQFSPGPMIMALLSPANARAV